MNAERIATALGGRRHGRDWMARCPAHHDRLPSLSIRECDGRVLVYCHAGCTNATVIEILRARGLWKNQCALPVKRQREVDHDDRAQRTQAALRIWHASRPPAGTLVETYLRSRGLRLPLPATLRCHEGLRHADGTVWPTMVALITQYNDEPIAIHRTFLARDGDAKAPVETPKMMLGACRGGAVRLAEAGSVLMVGEGIETCLATMQATKLPAWAGLSTSGLRTLELPPHVREVIVLADGDDAGEAAACDCAQRWKQEGRRVRLARPPRGLDFHDLLAGRTSTMCKAAP